MECLWGEEVRLTQMRSLDVGNGSPFEEYEMHCGESFLMNRFDFHQHLLIRAIHV